ncbi:MAG TPA: hypothetical protein VHE79_13690, partial [Spirochaetia bacterium]
MRVPAVIALLCLAAVPAVAVSVDELDVDFSPFHLIATADPDATGPSAIVQLYGVSLPLRLGGPWFVEPIVELFGTYYLWTGTAAAPSSMEWGTGFFTLGTLVSLHGGVSFPVTKELELGGSLGLDFLLRFPMEFQNNVDTSGALAWFFADGRFFYPETRLFLRWHIIERIDLIVNLRVFYPLFHAWDGSSFPFYDQLMATAGLGF